VTLRSLIHPKARSAAVSLPPPSLSPDEWIASLIAATPDTEAPNRDGIRQRPEAAMSGNGSGPKRRQILRPGWRRILGVAAVLLLAASVGFAGSAVVSRSNALRRLAATQAADRARLAGLQADLAAAQTAGTGAAATSKGNGKALPAKTKWIPDGRGIVVELIGYEDVVEIHDVHLNHAYGFSDLVGIAVNKSGHELSYMQLGCSLLDTRGRVLANVIDNRETWPAGASWGFDCSAEVNATGGIVRVDAAG
jgi:hypothetical protein